MLFRSAGAQPEVHPELPGAFRNVEAIGATTRLQREFGGGNRVPALRIAGWNFTGGTQG